VGCVAALAFATAGGEPASAFATAGAGSAPVFGAHVVVHFDLGKKQQPENIVVEPDGALDLSFAPARQVVRLGRGGEIRVLATLPAPAAPATPVLGVPFLTGLVRTSDGTLYFGYNTGTADLTGLWRLTRGGDLRRIVALPPDGLSNGLALDERAGELYVADSVLGTVWRAPLGGGTPVAWVSDPALRPAGFLGADGIKVHNGAVWVSNLDKGTIMRIPIRRDGTAGTLRTVISGLTGPDDFNFVGRGDWMLLALVLPSEVALVAPGHAPTIVLTAQDGLSNPDSIGIRGDTFYVPSGAFLTMKDPNLLVAHFRD